MAVIVTAEFALTFLGLNVNVAVVLPAGIDTEAGTAVAVVFELVRVTDLEDGPAGPVIVTVPVTVPAPPLMLDALKVKLARTAALTITVAFLLPLRVAVIVAVVSLATALEVNVVEPLSLPEAMINVVLENFPDAAGERLKATFAPEGPAGALSVTETVVESTPPRRVPTFDATVCTPAGETVKLADLLIDPSFPVTVTVLVASTGRVTSVKEPELAPASIYATAELNFAAELFDKDRAT